MERQNSHTIAWKRQVGTSPRIPGSTLPRTPGGVLPQIPGQNTLSPHSDMLAGISLVDEKQARGSMAAILCCINADRPLRSLNWHKIPLYISEQLHHAQHSR